MVNKNNGMSEVILGINISGFHSSAALIIDSEIKASITEERLSRVKRDKSFPKKAIQYCCNVANIDMSKITDIYIGWNPIFYLNKSDNTMNDALQNRGKLSYLALNELSSFNDEDVIEVTQQITSINSKWKIHFINHHHAHLSNSFLSSGFNKSDFIVADGFGENTAGIIGEVDYNKIEVLNDFRTPHSLGALYSTFTDYLGFNPNGDEWKVMALASLGNPNKYYDKVRKLVRVDGLNLELDLSYFEHYLFFTKRYFSPKFEEDFGVCVDDPDNLTQFHYDLVSSLQKVCEDIIIELLNTLHNHTKSKNIVLSGGVFMNSVLNGKVLDNTPYDNIYIGGSPDDSGISIGSALYGLVFDKKNTKQLPKMVHNYFGGEYTNGEIIDELKKRKIGYEIVDDVEKHTANILRKGNIVGWFQGKSEFGQRALGNRSIIADPTYKDVKDKVNSSIKYRESFRPFAPSILEEYQDKYFIIPKNQNSYFMEKVFKFRKGYNEILPGVVHFDNSGRIQTVSKDINPRYHKLISEFGELSNHPILLNTSFNVNGMPLVETPSDAINCFYSSGIDYLVMNNVIVKK